MIAIAAPLFTLMVPETSKLEPAQLNVLAVLKFITEPPAILPDEQLKAQPVAVDGPSMLNVPPLTFTFPVPV